MIATKNINKSYGNRHVLKDITITLKEGEITVLFGPSGCGKTTLMRNISLLDLPDTGEIKIFDAQIKFPLLSKASLKYPYPKLTVVFQQLFLWPHLTNKQNILLALDKDSLSYSDNIEYYKKIVSELEMESYIENFPNESSLGQKQRVAIARALILKPQYILFDEITASLDVVQIKIVLEILQKLKLEHIGIMFITHNIELAKKIGDQLIFMDEGEIVETGDAEILINPVSEKLKKFLSK